MSSNDKTSRLTPGFWVLLVALILVLVAAVLIFLPFWGPLFLAAVTAMLLHPAYVRILGLFGDRKRGLASAATCILFVTVVVVPLLWIGAQMAGQARGAIRSAAASLQSAVVGASANENVSAWLEEHPLFKAKRDQLLAVLATVSGEGGPQPAQADEPPSAAEEERPGDVAEREAPGGGISSESLISIATNATRILSGLLRGALGIFFKSAIFLVLLFFFLRDGQQLLSSIRKGIPLDQASQERVVRTFQDVTRSVLRGIFLTAMIQGTVAGIAYAILGKAAVFWGVVTAFCALVPALGTALVTVPMTLTLVLEQSYVGAVFMLVVACVIATMDNFIRPLLIKGEIQLHPVWILLAIMGGVLVFGFLGLVLGPMVIVLVRTLLKLVLETEGFTADGEVAPEGTPTPKGTPA